MEKPNINQTTLRILGLYLNDYSKALHVRQISREIGIDVKSVLIQLQKLEKMNILTSTMQGRNREYRLNLANSIALYYIIMAENFVSIRYLLENFLIKKVAKEMSRLLYDPILLFGSFAKGQATEDSDIDLFIITDRKIEKRPFLEIGKLVDRDINVQCYGVKKILNGLQYRDPLLIEVVSNHIVLKGADKFCDIMWRYYAGQ
ncbi:MAG: nucleotidyltransferase domain-containing protein [Conexivisphaerales archaeon]